ncbi:hypothetical protein [Streptomyces griseus]|uniref:hypothetical protein n=1 Tax=Streptomyces griseus TaxID=1911 RepID=UPI00099BE3B9|nr:hypothetical protein [Streptomyces griseus]
MEILALRHQLMVLERQLGKDRVRFTPSEGAFLAALLHRLPQQMLRELIRLRGVPAVVSTAISTLPRTCPSPEGKPLPRWRQPRASRPSLARELADGRRFWSAETPVSSPISHLVVYDTNIEVARHERLIAKGSCRLNLDDPAPGPEAEPRVTLQRGKGSLMRHGWSSGWRTSLWSATVRCLSG